MLDQLSDALNSYLGEEVKWTCISSHFNYKLYPGHYIVLGDHAAREEMRIEIIELGFPTFSILNHSEKSSIKITVGNRIPGTVLLGTLLHKEILLIRDSLSTVTKKRFDPLITSLEEEFFSRGDHNERNPEAQLNLLHRSWEKIHTGIPNS